MIVGPPLSGRRTPGQRGKPSHHPAIAVIRMAEATHRNQSQWYAVGRLEARHPSEADQDNRSRQLDERVVSGDGLVDVDCFRTSSLDGVIESG